ncbi:MAG: L,D-transpeptidase family protein [Thermoleophilia bacterium]
MSSRRIAILCCAAAAAVAAIPSAPAGAQPPLPGERIPSGITAAGTDLAGLTVDQAAAKLQSVHGARLERGIITVQAADITWKLKTADANVAFDALSSAKRAVYAGRESGGRRIDVPLKVTFEKGAVDRFVRAIDKRLYRAPRDSRLRISIRRVRVTHSRRGRDIGDRTLAKRISAALSDPQIMRVFKPRLISVRPKVTAGKLRRSASTVITIEQSTFTLRLFKRLKVVRRYKVAVGQPGYPTPRGLFAIQSKQVNPVWSVPNSPWAGELAGTTVTGGSAQNPLKARWMGVSGSVGIHGTGQEYSIGTRASHGCIRMRVNDVIALYKRVPLGTPVLIR